MNRFVNPEAVRELVTKALIKEAKECESLVAHYIKQNPDVPIGDICIVRKTTFDAITFWVGKKHDYPD